jgi:hypothetical protein
VSLKKGNVLLGGNSLSMSKKEIKEMIVENGCLLR